MKICPIAIAVGCRRCAIFKVCPVKGIIGDQVKTVAAPAAKSKAKAKKRS